MKQLLAAKMTSNGDANAQTAARAITVSNMLGLHARPATLVAKAAMGFDSKVVLEKGDQRVNARNVWDLLLLGAEQGEQLTIRATGDDAEAAVAAIEALFKQKFNED